MALASKLVMGESLLGKTSKMIKYFLILPFSYVAGVLLPVS